MKKSAQDMMKTAKFSLFIVLFLICGAFLPWIGAEKLHVREVLAFLGGSWSPDGMIFFHIRLPRVFLGLLAGGALAAAGATLQVVLRNPLAEPWTLGIAGGASLGAFLARILPFLWISWGWLNSAQLLAFAGASLALVLALQWSQRPGGGAQAMLLAGVTVGVISGGAIMVVCGFVSPWKLAEFHRWLLGGLDGADWTALGTAGALIVPALWILGRQARALNPLGLGEEMAAGQGVEVAHVRRWTLIGAGLAAAGVATVAGPIGFIGLLAPHAARRLIGPDMRRVLPASFLLGGALLAASDACGRWAAAPLELPVGALTALIGGPIFLWLLAKK